MSKVLQRVLGALALLILLAALFVYMGPKLLGPNVGARLTAHVSDTLGMQVSVTGPVTLRLFPRLNLTLENVRISNRGTDVAVIAEVQLSVALRSLIQQRIEVDGIRFKGAQIRIERDRNGRFNVDHSRSAHSTEPLTAKIGRVTFTDSSLVFQDLELANDFSAGHCDLDLKNLQIAPNASSDLLAALSFAGEFACAQMQTNNFSATSIKSRILGARGVITFDPATLRTFGGIGSGSLSADFTATEPRYHLRATVEKLQIADLSRTVKAASAANGELNFAADLFLRGTPKAPVARTANGQASLRGGDLALEIGDLDQELSRYESTQKFNLVDLGAFFLAGPLGVAVTKGYDYARILKKAPGITRIHTLISQWHVENGVAQAQDVALATPTNRIAMHGGLDFAAGTYQDVTVALVDAQGCARVEQKVHGSFGNPVIDRPSVVATVTGPVRRLVDKGKSLLGSKCPIFYSGSVPAPR
jgi:uncharacterized protein involved in outer membrane biogenesis